MLRNPSKLLQALAYLVIAVAMIFIIGIARNCGRVQTASLQGNSGGDTIDIAILYGPGSLYMYPDTLSGINFELIARYDKASQRPIKLWAVADAGEAMKKVDKGIFDILASMPLDNFIKEKFLTSESVYLDRLVLVQLTDTISGYQRIKTSLDLSGKKIHVASGSQASQRLENLAQEIGTGIEIIEDKDLSDELLCLKVATGEVDFAVVNEKVARNVAEKYPAFSYDTPVSFTQFQVWLFNQNDSLLRNDFDKWLKEFKTTEDYQEIIEEF